MIRIGTLKDAINERITVIPKIAEVTNFEDGKKVSTINQKELEVEIECTLEDKTYFFNFYVIKPFAEYINMKNYEKFQLKKTQIIEDFATINDEYETFPNIDIEIIKLNNKIVFTTNILSSMNEYFITAEFEVSLDIFLK